VTCPETTAPVTSHGATYALPGLTTRETAIVVWLGVLVAWVMTKPDIRGSFVIPVKTFFGARILVGVLLAAIACVIGTVLLLHRVGYWDRGMTKTTVLWFMGVGLATAFSIKRKDGGYFRRLLINNLTFAVVIEFLANLHTFPIYVELVLVPIVFLFVGTNAFAETQPQYALAAKVTGRFLTLVGLTALAFSLNYVVRNFHKLATVEQGKEFGLPLLLTACFVPFLYTVALFTVYQSMLHMVHFGLRGDESLYRFARRSILRACGVKLGRAQLFDERFRGDLWGATTETEVKNVINDFRTARGPT
jgi:hypothetical protein